jgi:hypothetical protein
VAGTVTDINTENGAGVLSARFLYTGQDRRQRERTITTAEGELIPGPHIPTEDAQIGQPIGSRLKHNNSNRKGDKVLLKGQVSIHCYEYIELHPSRRGRGRQLAASSE